jgi:Rieske Fe-S protein
MTNSNRILKATGFNKWCMSNGAVAAMVLSDQILEEENKIASLFDPTRSEIKKEVVKSFVKDNASVAKELILGKIEKPTRTISHLQKDEGGIVEYKGKKTGAYRDKNGHIHLVDTVCTHLGCATKWNDAERTWDCSCHGSRFSYRGKVLEAPAVNPLELIDEE